MKKNANDKFFDTLIDKNFNIIATLEELGLSLNDFNILCNDDDFYTRLKLTSRVRKTMVEMELYKRCLEKGDATSIKEFIKLMKENEPNNDDKTTYFVEFFEDINDE